MPNQETAAPESSDTPFDGPGGSPFRRVMSLRDFRLLFGGTATSLLGDQLALIATPWLVLQLTGDPLALGIVLALEGIPRAAFMLIGGALTDRYAPRRIMLISDLVRLVLTTAMAAAVLTGIVQMWMVYGFALGFGLVAGFAIPAENSIVPLLVAEDDLQAGNSLIMGVAQLAGFIGPSVAGAAIAAFSESTFGIGLALSIDAATFAVSTVCLWLIRGARAPSDHRTEDNLWASIGNGMKYLWADEALRLMFVVLIAINLLVVGPLMVGIPVLAHERLPQGAMAFGVLMAAFSVGNLAGYVLAGSLPRPSGRTIRAIIIGLLAAFGAVVGSLGFITSTWLDFGLLLLLGLGNGYLAIIMLTWIQSRVSKSMLGRMMSLITFSSLGLVSISQGISGAVSKWDIDALLLIAGGLVLAVTVWTAAQPSLNVLSESLAESPPNEEMNN
ncbi:MFS transporter [Actinomycetota bacterium]